MISEKGRKQLLERAVRVENAGGYFIVLAVLAVLFLLCDQTSMSNSDLGFAISEILIIAGFAICILIGFFMYKNRRLTAEKAVTLLIAAGFIVKLAYALRIGWYTNQHDVETLASSGHIKYIYRMAMGEGLPQTNEWQFYHPPLHHWLASLAVKASWLLGFANDRAFENVQLLTVFYSTAASIVCAKIFKYMGLKGKPYVAATAVIAIHPTFTIMAGSINNDILTILLMLTAMLYLIKWYKRPSYGNVAVIAVATGLAMMTKFSAALIAVVVGVAVIIRFIKDRDYNWSCFVPQTILFLVLSVPTGLWYQIRTSLKFGQPLGYVAPISTDSALYCGNEPLWRRLLPDLSQLNHIWCEPFGDYNLPIYTIKCSVFGEYSMGGAGVAVLLLLLNTLMIILSLIAMVKVLLINDENIFYQKWTLFVLWIVHVVFFVYFNISSPFGCTMDFRYIVPTLLCGAGFIGLNLAADNKKSTRFSKTKAIYYCTTALFCAVSVLYCL